MRRALLQRALVVVGVLVVAGLVWLATDHQRQSSDRAAEDAAAVERMVSAMLAQEVALEEYARTGREAALRDYRAGRSEYDFAAAQAQRSAGTGAAAEAGDVETDALLGATEAARSWQTLAEHEIRAGRRSLDAGSARRAAMLEDFRREAQRLFDAVDEERRRAAESGARSALLLALAVGLVLGVIALLVLEGRGREVARRAAQGRFGQVMQVARSEAEAHGLLKRYLENELPITQATVLRRNNSADRLEPTTPVIEGSKLAEGLDGATPDACLAVRLGKPWSTDDPEARLMRCEVCGEAGRSTCTPTLVGGEVIGAVHVQHEGRLRRTARDMVEGSVSQAAPVLANLRTLAVAEQQAATDALTGLPNARMARETIRRLTAQALRLSEVLGVVMFDLDHFKQVNDTFGHAKGDEVLAAVGDAVGGAVRASDVVARLGGEEFLVLLPGTDRAGSVEVAEKLRAVIGALRVPGVSRTLSASFGVAVCPDDGLESDQLMRMADRALYLAKNTGRDRVCVVEGAAPGAPADA